MVPSSDLCIQILRLVDSPFPIFNFVLKPTTHASLKVKKMTIGIKKNSNCNFLNLISLEKRLSIT